MNADSPLLSFHSSHLNRESAVFFYTKPYHQERDQKHQAASSSKCLIWALSIGQLKPSITHKPTQLPFPQDDCVIIRERDGCIKLGKWVASNSLVNSFSRVDGSKREPSPARFLTLNQIMTVSLPWTLTIIIICGSNLMRHKNGTKPPTPCVCESVDSLSLLLLCVGST